MSHVSAARRADDHRRSASQTTFPVGYRSFHADPSINFELNRWLGALPEEELRAAAPRIASLADWKTVMLELAERAERDAEGRDRRGARSPAHPRRRLLLPRGRVLPRRRRSRQGPRLPSLRRAVRSLGRRQFRTAASACRSTAAGCPRSSCRARGSRHRRQATILFHGGFDSLQEELFDWALVFAEGGYDVVLFEGPGPGRRAAGPWTGDAAGLGATGGRGARPPRNRARHHPGHLARRLSRTAGGGVRAAHRAGDRLRRPRRLLRVLHRASGRAAGGHSYAAHRNGRARRGQRAARARHAATAHRPDGRSATACTSPAPPIRTSSCCGCVR